MRLKLFFIMVPIIWLSNSGYSVNQGRQRQFNDSYIEETGKIRKKIETGTDLNDIIRDIRKIFYLFEIGKISLYDFTKALKKFYQDAAEHGHILHLMSLLDIFERSGELTQLDAEQALKNNVRIRTIHKEKILKNSDLRTLLRFAAKSNSQTLEQVTMFANHRGYNFTQADLQRAYAISIIFRKPLSFEYFKKNQIDLNMKINNRCLDEPAVNAIDHLLYPKQDKRLEEIILFCLLVNEGFRPAPNLIENAYDLIDIDKQDIVSLLGASWTKESHQRLALAITMTFNALND